MRNSSCQCSRLGDAGSSIIFFFFFRKGCRGFPMARVGWGAPLLGGAPRHAIMCYGAARFAALANVRRKKETTGDIADDAMRCDKKDYPKACLAQRHGQSSFRGMQLAMECENASRVPPGSFHSSGHTPGLVRERNKKTPRHLRPIVSPGHTSDRNRQDRQVRQTTMEPYRRLPEM